ncbi:S26 family signal peptidase [Deltaproteobacteria bacterium]|nr:S26 family signal peptidase [Deltaproteobacteria bacterium]
MSWNLLREACLAVGMIGVLILSLWGITGQMPPLVVVESDSMVHNAESGEVGSIDAGDLILVHQYQTTKVITFAEATYPNNKHYGHSSHGMNGDVIIYEKNGEVGTPIIHRAILEAVPSLTKAANDSTDCNTSIYDSSLKACILSWDVPGTTLRNVSSISWVFDGNWTGEYDCQRNSQFNHGEVGMEKFLTIENWKPQRAGFMTLGDNNKCSVDQGWSPSKGGVAGATGLFDSNGVGVDAVSRSHLVGIAGGEIPWLGTVKLMMSGDGSPGTSQVPSASWGWLFISIASVLALPIILEPLLNRIINGSPEVAEAEQERNYAERFPVNVSSA